MGRLVMLTKTEWELLCTQGVVEVLVERFQDEWDESTGLESDWYAGLFARAPRFVLGDATGLVVAQLQHEIAGTSPAVLVKRIDFEAVESFFPLTASARGSLQDQPPTQHVKLDPPKLEPSWQEWTAKQRRRVKIGSARSLLKAVRLDGPISWGCDLSGDELDAGSGLGIQDPTALRLNAVARDVISDDRARAVEGTCPHSLVSATLWASHCYERDIPADDSPLVESLGAMYDQLIDRRFGEVDHLSRTFHSGLELIKADAPLAFGEFVSPTSVGIYFRFWVAARYGPRPQPKDLLDSILRLKVLDGDSVAAACCYLVGLELAPEYVQQIRVALSNGSHPLVDLDEARRVLGLSSYEELLASSLCVPETLVVEQLPALTNDVDEDMGAPFGGDNAPVPVHEGGPPTRHVNAPIENPV
jgi:hypothetical protein